MDSQEMRDRYYGGEGQSRDAFEELCALYDAIQVLNVSFSFVFLKILVTIGKYFFPSIAKWDFWGKLKQVVDHGMVLWYFS